MLRPSHQAGGNLNWPQRSNTMNPHQASTPPTSQPLSIFQIVALALILIVFGVGFMSSTAQTTSQASVTQRTPERELKDEIPKHVPIKVKVKNLNSEKWTRDLEVEVTNTGDKPIFFLFLILSLPDVQSDTNRVMSF